MRKLDLQSLNSYDKVRLLSAQSPKVLEIAQHGFYRARAELSREGRNYDLERQMLHGCDPIWGFIPDSWDIQDYYDGEILECFRREMSLPQKDSWSGLVLLELSLPSPHVKIGRTHNASKNVVVFSYIQPGNIQAAYKLTDVERPAVLEGLVPPHYFKVIEPVYINPMVSEVLTNTRVNLAEKYIEIFY